MCYHLNVVIESDTYDIDFMILKTAVYVGLVLNFSSWMSLLFDRIAKCD